MTTEARALRQDCAHIFHIGHYEMPGYCLNCTAMYTLFIPKGHEAPSHMLGWTCEVCGTSRVGADRTSVRWVPTEEEREAIIKRTVEAMVVVLKRNHNHGSLPNDVVNQLACAAYEAQRGARG